MVLLLLLSIQSSAMAVESGIILYTVKFKLFQMSSQEVLHCTVQEEPGIRIDLAFYRRHKRNFQSMWMNIWIIVCSKRTIKKNSINYGYEHIIWIDMILTRLKTQWKSHSMESFGFMISDLNVFSTIYFSTGFYSVLSKFSIDFHGCAETHNFGKKTNRQRGR